MSVIFAPVCEHSPVVSLCSHVGWFGEILDRLIPTETTLVLRWREQVSSYVGGVNIPTYHVWTEGSDDANTGSESSFVWISPRNGMKPGSFDEATHIKVRLLACRLSLPFGIPDYTQFDVTSFNGNKLEYGQNRRLVNNHVRITPEQARELLLLRRYASTQPEGAAKEYVVPRENTEEWLNQVCTILGTCVKLVKFWIDRGNLVTVMASHVSDSEANGMHGGSDSEYKNVQTVRGQTVRDNDPDDDGKEEFEGYSSVHDLCSDSEDDEDVRTVPDQTVHGNDPGDDDEEAFAGYSSVETENLVHDLCDIGKSRLVRNDPLYARPLPLSKLQLT